MIYTDEEILKKLQRDRETGAVMLMEEYAGLIWSVCEMYLDNEEDIRECVNSTFADFCLEREKFDAKKASLKTYLCAIARNKAIDCYRTNRRHQTLLERAEEAFDNGAAGDRLAERLEEAVEQLEPLDGRILRMKYYGGHSYQEIADELGLKEGAVKMRSMRSRRKLLKILIGTLILLLLAACAAAVIGHYHFSEYGGIVWSSEARMYELDDGEYSCQFDGHRLCVDDAFVAALDDGSAKGMVTLYLTITPPGDVQSLDEYAAQENYLDRFGLFSNRPGVCQSSMKRTWDDEYKCLKYQIEMSLDTEEANPARITMPLYMGEEHLMDITLVPARFREFEMEQKSIAFWDDLEWLPGPAMAGEEQTVVNMIQYSDGTWSVSPQLTSSRYSQFPAEHSSILLISEDETEYELRYGSADNYPADSGTALSQYNLYFPPVPAGTYTLAIPYIFLKSSETSDPFTLTLPLTEGQTLACDVTALFPEGSGIRITGVTKSEYIQTSYDLDAESGELVERNTYYWDYVLDIQTLSSNALTFHMAVPECVDGTSISSAISEKGELSLQILQGEEPSEITLRFTEPEYLLKQAYTLEVTVQKSEE